MSMIEPVKIPLDNEVISESLEYLNRWEIDSINRDINDIIKRYEDTGKVGNQAWILVWQSRILRAIEDHGLSVVDEHGANRRINWKKLLPSKSDDFPSHFFEFEVAALLLSFGYDVKFVEARGDARSPDLLVGEDMWIECKRKRDEAEIQTWDREKNDILDAVIEEGMSLDDTIHSFTVTFQGSKQPHEIEEIGNTLRGMIEQNLDVVTCPDYEITRTEQAIDTLDAGTKLQLGKEYFTPGAVDMKMVNFVNEDGEVEGFTAAEIRFDFGENWFYPKKIHQSLEDARSRNLADKQKGVVFVSVPQLYLPDLLRRMTPPYHLAPGSSGRSQLERLDEVVTKRFLNNTETVNAVCLLVNTFTRDIAYSPLVLYWQNTDCRHPDEGFVDTLDRMSKSYYGYLLANS